MPVLHLVFHTVSIFIFHTVIVYANTVWHEAVVRELERKCKLEDKTDIDDFRWFAEEKPHNKSRIYDNDRVRIIWHWLNELTACHLKLVINNRYITKPSSGQNMEVILATK